MDRRCVWITAEGGTCPRDGRVHDQDAPVALCPTHWRVLQGWARSFQLEDANDAVRRAADLRQDEYLEVVCLRLERHRLLTQAAEDLDRSCYVYVVQRRDRLVKIGTTGQPRRRFPSLRATYGPLQVLLVVVGSYEEEAALHRRFAAHVAEGREWFHPHPQLMDWVADRAASDLAMPLP